MPQDILRSRFYAVARYAPADGREKPVSPGGVSAGRRGARRGAGLRSFFYKAEPRDDEWFYGAGKGLDSGSARDDALKHLLDKIGGGDASVPREVLSGWEQDDRGQCGGVRYALVRIRNSRARANLADARGGGVASDRGVPVDRAPAAGRGDGRDREIGNLGLPEGA